VVIFLHFGLIKLISVVNLFTGVHRGVTSHFMQTDWSAYSIVSVF